jgi:hypothetical protein
MTKIVLLALGLLVMALPPTLVQAQNAQAPKQSLQDRPSACGNGSQSVRVCANDLQSCNSVCDALALDATTQVAGCSTRCCTQYNVCLRLRGCGSRVFSCN